MTQITMQIACHPVLSGLCHQLREFVTAAAPKLPFLVTCRSPEVTLFVSPSPLLGLLQMPLRHGFDTAL